jgi:hypothetical protein
MPRSIALIRASSLPISIALRTSGGDIPAFPSKSIGTINFSLSSSISAGGAGNG